MAVLYLVNPGGTLASHSEQLVVRDRRETRQRVPIRSIDTVAILAPTHLTSGAIALCARRGVELVIAARRGTDVALRLNVSASGIQLRRSQFHLSADPIATLAMARAFVAGKIRNQRRLLGRSRASAEPEVQAARAGLGRSLERAASALTIDELRGVEGNASAAYFGGFAAMLNPEFEFVGRNRRPPRDPVNALLSFAYTILTGEVAAAVTAAGLEPALGFFHEPRAGRPALALDLVEEFRAPVADALVLHVTGRRIIRPSQFRPRDAGVWMNTEARRRLVIAYEEKLSGPFTDLSGARTSLRLALRAQAERLALSIRDTTPYEAFRLP